jgi:hypothetical protein
VLVYYYDIGKATNGVVTGSVQQDGKLSEDRANVGTEKERDGRDESFYKTGDTLMMALGIYQTLGVPIMKLLEAIAFAAKSAAGSGGLAVGYTGLLAWMTYRTSKALAVCLSPVIITLGLLEATLRFVYTLLKPLGIGLVQLYRHISNGLATLFSPELLTVES